MATQPPKLVVVISEEINPFEPSGIFLFEHFQPKGVCFVFIIIYYRNSIS